MQSITIQSKKIERIRRGYPWVYAQDIQSKHISSCIAQGELVYLSDEAKQPFAIGYYNPSSKLACRVLTWDISIAIDEAFFYAQFAKALAFRQKRFHEPFYRLIHAESDGLPGLIIDRFEDTLVCQTNTAGMEQLKPLWLPALHALLKPNRVILRDDTPARLKEGLPLEVIACTGSLEGVISVKENGMIYYADPCHGQKTGWFFDHRMNRHWLSQRTKGKTVLDLYTYSGGFGLLLARHGAKQVTLVDGSEEALSLAKEAAKHNQVSTHCTFTKENVFHLLPQLIEQGQQFDIVIADPPAFIKQAKHKGAGLSGYRKLSTLASQVVSSNGLLFIASCSHHASSFEFREAVEQGIQRAGRKGALLRKYGAGADHPIHPCLPETHYLKSLVYKLTET